MPNRKRGLRNIRNAKKLKKNGKLLSAEKERKKE